MNYETIKYIGVAIALLLLGYVLLFGNAKPAKVEEPDSDKAPFKDKTAEDDLMDELNAARIINIELWDKISQISSPMLRQPYLKQLDESDENINVLLERLLALRTKNAKSHV